MASLNLTCVVQSTAPQLRPANILVVTFVELAPNLGSRATTVGKFPLTKTPFAPEAVQRVDLRVNQTLRRVVIVLSTKRVRLDGHNNWAAD